MVNYKNSIIYKLCCKDPTITEIYIGSTTSFRARKCGHKTACTNEKSKAYNYYVYQFIRDHGCWDNWDMIQIETRCADDKHELLSYERLWIEELGASLNKNIPTRTMKEYRKENKESIRLWMKEYRKENKEVIATQEKEYRKENKELIRQKYYEKNKESFIQRNKEKISCDCGSIISRVNLARHRKTKKHQKWVGQNQ